MNTKQITLQEEIEERRTIILSDREKLANRVYEGKATKWEEELFFELYSRENNMYK